MLSRKKGTRYGEGHQKALQISIGMLPRARVRMLEGAVCLPSLRHKRNACASLCTRLFFLAVGRILLFPHDGGGREVDDGLSDHEAAEMSAPTLLRR